MNLNLDVERPWVCLAALVVIGLTVVAIAVGPAVGGDAIVKESIHTTDTDFNNAATLDNLSVSGSGDSAEVQLRQTDEFFDDQVTRTADNNQAETEDGVGLQVETGNRVITTLRVRYSANNECDPDVRLTDDSGTVVATHDSGISNGVRFDDLSLSKNTKYHIEAYNIPTGCSIGFYDNFDDSTPVTSSHLDILRGSSPTGTSPSNLYAFKTVEYDYKETPQGTYLSQNHSVTDADGGQIDLRLDNVDATVQWQGWDGTSWVTVDSTTRSSTGTYETTWTENHDKWRVKVDYSPTSHDGQADLHMEGVGVTSSAPDVDNASASPSGGTTVNDSPVELSIDIGDADFSTTESDEVTLEWYHNGTLVGTTTHTQNETATIESDEGVGGTNGWHVEATDEQGHTTTSQTFTFESPSELEIRDVHTGNLITTAEVTVQFYHGEDDDIVVEETTTDGKVDLSGIGAEEEILVDVDTDDYYQRAIIITSIWDQQKIYMLNSSDTSVDAVQPRFRLNDPSGTFVEDNSDLLIQRPLNHSGTGSEWITVSGDEFGAEGYTVWLEQGVRYRLILRNDLGDQRTLGSFRPTSTETIELKVEGIEYGFQIVDEPVQYDISYNEETGEVEFAYLDEDSNTTELNLQIFEQGNKTNNEIANKTWTPGNDVSFAVTADNETNWVVEFQATRDGEDEDIEVARVVGETKLGIGPDLDPRWSTIAGMGLLVVVGGLFGRGRPEVGAIAVSLLGGILWLIGWMPGATTGAMIVVGIFTSVLFYAHSRGGIR